VACRPAELTVCDMEAMAIGLLPSMTMNEKRLPMPAPE
jgi:hypothetical protein